MKPTKTATSAPVRSSHQVHQSGFLPLKNPTGFFTNAWTPVSPAVPACATLEYGGSSNPILSRSASGECKIHTPSTNPANFVGDDSFTYQASDGIVDGMVMGSLR